MTSIKIVSYNLLCPNLCNDEEFIYYKKEYLDENIRKNKIYKLFNDWINEEYIICIQELSSKWKGELEIYFNEHNYRLFSIQYGNKKNGFMGIGIGVPKNLKVLNIEYINIGNNITTNSTDRIYNWQEQKGFYERKENESIFEDIIKYIDEISIFKEEEINNRKSQINQIITEAKERKNFTIRCTIEREDEKRFIIYNYHMPCTFKKPVIQSIHIDTLKKILYEHKNIPTILAGDFNITPNSNEYNYIISNSIKDTHRIYLPYKDYSEYSLKSCLKEYNEREPLYTCYSHTKIGGEFKNTLDYIFVNEQIKVIEADRICLAETKMPNLENPSDHLPIYSILELS